MKKYFVKCVVAMVVALSVFATGVDDHQGAEASYICACPLGGYLEKDDFI